jgi:hypothetical protein
MAWASISSGVAFVLLAVAVPPPAVPPEPVLADHRFDLAAASLTQPMSLQTLDGERLLPRVISPGQFGDEPWTPPRKTWGSAESGPVFQIGALGSKDKRIPDIAHISLDWDF